MGFAPILRFFTPWHWPIVREDSENGNQGAMKLDDILFAELERGPSTVRMTRPLYTAIVGSIRSLRRAQSRARMRSSAAPASRE
jgi:hypothetical protein